MSYSEETNDFTVAESAQKTDDLVMDIGMTYSCSGRVLKTNSGSWSPVDDICKIFDLSNDSNILSSIPKKWQKTLKFKTDAGKQDLLCVSQAGLLKLGFQAKEFQKEVNEFFELLSPDHKLKITLKNFAQVS